MLKRERRDEISRPEIDFYGYRSQLNPGDIVARSAYHFDISDDANDGSRSALGLIVACYAPETFDDAMYTYLTLWSG